MIQPDQPGNVGAMARLTACLGVGLDVVEPCGFPFSPVALRRSAMDYLAHADIVRHADWATFEAQIGGRLIALAARADLRHTDFAWATGDVLLLGQESGGLPPQAHAVAAARVRVPMRAGLRSLNVVAAAAVVLGEALRQTEGWPG